jgi:hypothetical protein
MVPLERVLTKRSVPTEPVFVPRKPRPRPPEPPKPREPRKFRVVDVMSRQVLADGAHARETVEVLKRFRSVVDVEVFVWQPEREGWRLLTLAERDAVWKLRDRVPGVLRSGSGAQGVMGSRAPVAL